MENLFDYPASRNTDPLSSYIAEEKITKKGKRTKQAMIVLEALKKRNGSTSRELAQLMSGDRYITSRRLPDLEKAGMVKRGELRICNICKQKCVTWYVT